MRTSRKLWLGFGTLTALLVLSSAAISVRVSSVDGQVRAMADARNLGAAVAELRIGALGYDLGIRTYLQTGDAMRLRDATDSAAAVNTILKSYEHLEPSDRRRGMAARFKPLWQELITLGEALVDPESSQLKVVHSKRFFELRTRLDKLLTDEMQVDALATYNQRKDAALADVQAIKTFALIMLAGGSLLALGTSVAVGRGVVRADRQLRENAANLVEADRRKDEFLAMLAHELRNPLAPVSNALQALHLEGADKTLRPEVTAMMERQIGQMMRLVDDLLDVSRISRGKIELRRETVELAPIIHHAVEAVRPLCESMAHELAVSLPATPIYLHADPVRLAQVIGNLLNNACKFTDHGGRIALSVECEGGEVQIRVRDNGIGIGAQQLARVFDPFMQADTSLGRADSGIGVGLALVHNLVEMHGGTVTAHSAGLGQGSEFVVRLPILEGVETPTPTPTPTLTSTPALVPAPAQAVRRRVLVVDDNRDSAESMSVLMELAGHETRTAFDGNEALDAATTWQPDVVLLDLGLPGLDGFEVARAIRRQPWGARVVLLALTGWGQAEDRTKSRAAGFDGHLVKPASHASIMKLLEEIFAGAGRAG